MPANSDFAFDTNWRFEMSTGFESELVAKCTAISTPAKIAIAASGAPITSSRRFERRGFEPGAPGRPAGVCAVDMHEPFDSGEREGPHVVAPPHRRTQTDPAF